ncbi:TatD family hydrolase [Oleidesulfovibrio alaskensis]|uniref:TatD family hydrolase n=1 Tax=Oleidesulfovibrio alaskensis TaxID=58180 RepID=UPI0003F5BD90|nr:TatD family hydrolase [Oleidesulfovibrio alaskensis]
MSKSKHKTPPPAAHTLGLPPVGVDSHAHLDLDALRPDLDEILTRAREAGVSHIGQVFLGPQAWAQNRHLFDAYPQVFFILGLHPCDADACDENAVTAMKQAFATDPRLKAVGEIGLDYYWDDHPRELQQKTFVMQLRMAVQIDKPVVIHSRDADEDTVRLLEAEGFAGRPLLWHCFGADTALAERIVRNGWHVSVPGPVTYPANNALREALSVIPADRLMLETDCPYLTPVPWRGRRNEPALAAFTGACVARCLGIDPAELWTRCGNNARAFFGIQ